MPGLLDAFLKKRVTCIPGIISRKKSLLAFVFEKEGGRCCVLSMGMCGGGHQQPK
jgi:hypothetical protein